MEFLISGYLNVCDLSFIKTGLSGEIISYVLGWLAILVTLLIIPGLLIMVLKMTPSEIKEDKFAREYYILWEGISTKSKPKIAYYLVFCLRRVLFCAIAFYFEPDEPKVMPLKYSGIQIQCLFMLNILITIYFGYFMPKLK